MTRSCEDSCPYCFVGEVENHKCSNCGREFCNVCHGIKLGNSYHNVLACNCSQEKPKVKVVTKKVVTTDDSGHYRFMSCGVCGAKVKDEDKGCSSCHALFMD